MGVRFLLGPAGSGKTWRCLDGIRAALRARAWGPPLLLLAPKQATFQLERQLLASPGTPGFARLHILSFERLAYWILDRLDLPEPRLLDEVGRTMVLRGVLEELAPRLAHLGRSARTPGFARELSRWLGQLLQQGNNPARMEAAAARQDLPPTLRAKLSDLALVQRRYAEWLATEGVHDQDQLLEVARRELARRPRGEPLFDGLWMDGFAEMTPLEVSLLAAVVSRSGEATLAYCVDPDATPSPGNLWSVVADCFRRCHAAVATASGTPPCVEHLRRGEGPGRFEGVPGLAALEASWARRDEGPATPPDGDAVRVVACDDAHAEAEFAAAQVLQHVAGGGRFRDVAVLARDLESYGPTVERTFRRRGIPCFLDQRFPIRHHPLVEMTRSALRIAANPAEDDDWFAWLKCGLLGLPEWEAERIENTLLRERWKGHRWTRIEDVVGPASGKRVLGPVMRLREQLSGEVGAPVLATALRGLWRELGLEALLEEWDRDQPDMYSHRTVLRETEAWLEGLVRGFGSVQQPLRAWLPILETAWNSMTAGAIPPSLDQVLVGAIDRSRNPDLRLVILPGWAEDVFPAPAPSDGLLSRSELEQLAGAGLDIGPGILERIGHERFYAYIALTRTRERVVVTVPSRLANGRALPASPFLRALPPIAPATALGPATASVPPPAPVEVLGPGVAHALFGRALRTSASSLEQFATCPLQHALQRILGVRERDELEYDARREGTLQHEILAEFHRAVRRAGRRWRDVPLSEALAILAGVTGQLEDTTSPQARFERSITVDSVKRFLVAWFGFVRVWPLDPTHAELQFGKGEGLKPLEWPVANGVVRLEGTIDRVDVGDREEGGRCLFVVDYKLSGERLATAEFEAGRQLQLPLYLLAAATLPTGPHRLVGMAYASLSPKAKRLGSRAESGPAPDSPAAYEHRGRVDASWAASHGDWSGSPFSIRFKTDGTPDLRGDAMDPADFSGLLESARQIAGDFGSRILSGDFGAHPATVSGKSACEYCAMATTCRHPRG